MRNIAEMFSIFSDEEKTIMYLCEENVIETFKTCNQCKGLMRIDIKRKLFICRKNKCKKQLSIYKNTFFSVVKCI